MAIAAKINHYRFNFYIDLFSLIMPHVELIVLVACSLKDTNRKLCRLLAVV